MRKYWESVPEDGADFDFPILYPMVRDIEGALLRLKLPPAALRHGLVFVPVHKRAGDDQTRTVTDGVSLIEISSNTVGFCVEVGKAMALTVPGPVKEARLRFEKYKTDDTLPVDGAVLDWWADILLQNVTEENPQYKFAQAPGPNVERTLVTADAMAIFLIAHECGHHVFKYFKIPPEEMHEEHRADIFARMMCTEVATVRNMPRNMVLQCAAGGVILLGSLEMLLRARQVLENGNDELPISETHPSFLARVAAIDDFEKKEFKSLGPKLEISIGLRADCVFILDGIWRALKPRFEEFRRQGIKPLPSDSVMRLLRW